MWTFWTRHAPVWAPAGEGEGEGAEDQQGASADGEGEGSAGEAGEGQSGSAGSSILDFATKEKAEDGKPGDEWKLPDGLSLPDHLLGSSADETLSKVAKAYAGARRELSTKGKTEGALEGAVPDKPEGYVIEADGDDDKIAAELTSEASKPYVDAFRAAALKVGIPDKAFAAFMREGMAGISEQGVALGVSDEDASRISGEAEMEALTKEVGKAEAGTIVNTLGNYAEKLQARGVLSDDADAAEFAQMVGTARAARIFHRILTGELGERPIPPGIGAEGAATPEEAYAAHAEASSMKPGAERDAALAAANKKIAAAYGQNPTGSIRSNVM